MGSSGDNGSSNKLFVRHSMKTNFVAGLNAILTEEQKDVISKTSFAWFLELQDNLKIGRNILSDLLIRWVDERGGFKFGDKIVEFKEEDVSLALGLGLVGDEINLNAKLISPSPLLKLFGTEKGKGKGKYELDMIYNFVLKKHKKLPCMDVCSLYLFVGISEVLLPCRTRIVNPNLFEIVNTTSDLSHLCWCRFVYQYLLSSFSKAFVAWKGGKGASTVYVDGCVYVFKVWFCDRFLPSNSVVHKFPRILHWMSVNVGDKFVKAAMDTGVMLDEYGKSRKEIAVSCSKASVDEENNDDGLDDVLHEQDVLIEELEQELFALKGELLDDINTDEVALGATVIEQEFFNDFGTEGRDNCNESDKKEGQRRKRFKSIACRTPYTGYSPNLG